MQEKGGNMVPLVRASILTLAMIFAWACALNGQPASEKIAFVSNLEICVVDADGTNWRQLTGNAAYEDNPTWSPDGTKIAFQSNRDGQMDIYVMRADGSNPTRLTFAGGACPSWSPDGGRIAYVAPKAPGLNAITVIDADGGDPTRLTSSYNLGQEGAPCWSPDGTQIAFYADLSICLMEADGSDLQVVPNARGLDPSWSPDGTRIAFYSGNAEVYVIDVDGSNPQGLTLGNSSSYDAAPTWSPDGTRIAYHSSSSGHLEIWTMDADGGGQEQLTFLSAHSANPEWSAAPAPPEPPTPEEELALLIAEVEALVVSGTLTPDQGDGLISKLDAAAAKLEQARARPATNQLRAFVNQARAFMRSGKLPPEEGQMLTDAVEGIVSSLNGGTPKPVAAPTTWGNVKMRRE